MGAISQAAYGTIVSAMTTELNSLANNAWAISSALGGDASAQYLYGDFELAWSQAATPTVDTSIDLYLIRSADGTNYEDGATSGPVLPGPNSYIGSFAVRGVSSAQRRIIRDVRLPPGLFKAFLLNNATGTAFASSGNTLKWRPHNLTVA